RDVTAAYETAAYLFKQALDADPGLSNARLSRAIILYEQLSRPREAEGELKLILNRFAPADAKYLLVLATSHLARLAELEGDWKRSETFWLNVRTLDSLNSDAYVGIGDSFFERAMARPDAAVNPVDTTKPASDPKPTEGRPNTPDPKVADAHKS